MEKAAWVTDENVALFTDLYELTMLQAYFKEGMTAPAVFDLFVRKLPDERNFLIACGLESVLHYLEHLRFSDRAIDYLASLGKFSPDFLEYLRTFRFTGNVYAVPEGTVVFQNEPILEIEAPIGEAQLIETFLLNQITHQTLMASKAIRVVEAARGRATVDFGVRRMHGTDAGMKAARAFYIAGMQATSNVLAGEVYGIPVTGTMAHSYIEAHLDEYEAFKAFASLYPDTILLVDTYDSIQGVKNVIRLAKEWGDRFKVQGIRLDSGDLVSLSKKARQLLDEAGLTSVRIFVSGGLDEYEIDALLRASAPIDGFGVGTRLGVSADVPYLDSAYKLVAYAGEGRMKLSAKKATLPGKKQVFRQMDEQGKMVKDIIALAGESLEGEPLLRPVMQGGKRLPESNQALETIRAYTRDQVTRLPEHLRTLTPAEPRYPVEVSARLQQEAQRLRQQLLARYRESKS